MEGSSRDRELGRQTGYYDPTTRFGYPGRYGIRTITPSYCSDVREESSSLETLQWRNTMLHRPYMAEGEMGYRKSEFHEGLDRTVFSGYSNGLLMSPLGKLDVGIQKNESFINFDNSLYGQGQGFLHPLDKNKEVVQLQSHLGIGSRYVKEDSLGYFNDVSQSHGNGEMGYLIDDHVGENFRTQQQQGCLSMRPSNVDSIIVHNFDNVANNNNNNPFGQSSRQGSAVFSNEYDDVKGGLFRRDDQDEEVLGLKRRLVDYEGSNYGGDSEISWLGREKDVVGSLNRLVAMPESDDRVLHHQRIERDDQYERLVRRKGKKKKSMKRRINDDSNGGSYQCHGYGGFDNKARGDVKKRLGPIQKDPISVSFRGRLEPSNKVFLKRKKKDSLRKTTDNNINGSLDKVVKPSKTPVSEDSDEFHRLVEKAFFKFIKNLHEHPAQRRKYLDQEGESTLKCCVCGSSKEFLCPLELVKHALTSHKRELRAEHLGFHKALCVLLGWNSATAPNTPWVLQILPRAEATALREDLIIWPPVVIIQNISIANRNLDERVIVSIQMYEAILRDMGFNGEKTKVFRGKAANQSILVAIFNATLSGLQEAERLHKHYAENKHGRLELQQTNSTDHNNTHRDTRELTESEKLESVLYGYLGIVEDLDKLDFNIKSHCVVRSKKEIQAISDATL
ncbi:uncharacterized protein LOC115719197 [Cannabis sativa]|uniref:uncharacterized protein LOC115719197 n=1 Tax=Cannabis sativa TaxID=3483 RepID=UPI0029CA7FA9|nr:uncharacterized protein LOC115719197 [Cannabis sativa]